MISEKEIPPVERSLPYTENKIEKIPGDKKDKIVEKTNISQDYKPFADNLIPYEGIKEYVYNDGKGLPTIGIGHLITPKSLSIFKDLFNISDQEYNNIISKKRKLTDDQIYKLFYEYDLKKHINKAKARLPKFDSYPKYIQVALVNAVYRGDLGKNTANLINANNWSAAAKGYIKHKDYNSPNPRLKGITPRMNQNQKAMLQYAKELGQI
jgi:GH24 family phage-related lysozyme (muramidase)